MVEWKKLGDVCKVLRGKRLTKSQLNESEGYPVLHGGSTPMGYYEEFNRKANTTVVVNTGNAGSVFFYDKEFWSSDACFSLYPNKEINDKFLYLYVYGCERILKGKIRAGAMPTIDAKAVEDLLIPIPSHSEQQRIVSILDTFTSSISNLKQQIEERRKQYEYERDLLLDLEGKEGVEMKKLGEIGDVTKLAGFEFTEHVTYQEDGKIIALRGLNVRDGHLDLNQVKYIDGSNFAKLSRSKLVINDMLFTYVGTIGNVALIDENEKYYLAPNVSRIRFDESIINPKYALYIFMSQSFHRTQINKFLNSSSMKNLSMENIRKFILPIPPLSTQSRIVSILDTFEQSISNLEEQLAMREKQYEYYRNQLLTFEGEEERGKT